MKWLILLLVIILQTACKDKEVKIPEYATHDWYAHYVIDGEEHTIIKDGTDNKEPYLYSYQYFGATTNPDGTENVSFVQLTSGLQTTSAETDSIMWFEFTILTENGDLLDSKGKTKEERGLALLNYLMNMEYINSSSFKTEGELIALYLGDKRSNAYDNELFSNGYYAEILEYGVKVVEANKYEHQHDGEVVRVKIHFEGNVRDRNFGQDHSLIADVQTYIQIPFE